MTIKDQKITEFQTLYKECFGIDITLEQAKIEATKLVNILRILKRAV